MLCDQPDQPPQPHRQTLNQKIETEPARLLKEEPSEEGGEEEEDENADDELVDVPASDSPLTGLPPKDGTSDSMLTDLSTSAVFCDFPTKNPAHIAAKSSDVGNIVSEQTKAKKIPDYPKSWEAAAKPGKKDVILQLEEDMEIARSFADEDSAVRNASSRGSSSSSSSTSGKSSGGTTYIPEIKFQGKGRAKTYDLIQARKAELRKQIEE